jgi:outer membrane protein TolC
LPGRIASPAQSAYDRARIDTQKARRSPEIAQLALGHMLKPKQAEPIPSSSSTSRCPSSMPWVQETLAVHPGLKLLTAKKEQAQGMIKLEKGKYAPELFLFGNYNLYEDDSLPPRPRRTGWSRAQHAAGEP